MRELGYATAIGSPIPGVNAIGAPVFDHTRQLQLAVTVIGLGHVVDLSPEGRFVRRLNEFVSSLSAELGYMANLEPQEGARSRSGRSSWSNGPRQRTRTLVEKESLES